MYEKSPENERIWRWGRDTDELEDLRRKSAQAYEVIKIHGVTAFAGQPPQNAVVSYATVKDLAAMGFHVYVTPLNSNPEHRTVELPNPITHKIVSVWNDVWNRKKNG